MHVCTEEGAWQIKGFLYGQQDRQAIYPSMFTVGPRIHTYTDVKCECDIDKNRQKGAIVAVAVEYDTTARKHTDNSKSGSTIHECTDSLLGRGMQPGIH